MSQRQRKILSAFLAAAPFACLIVCLGIGRYQISIPETVRILLSPLTGSEVEPTAYSVLFNVRLPRLLLSLFFWPFFSYHLYLHGRIFNL